jgi:hypothetical protein
MGAWTHLAALYAADPYRMSDEHVEMQDTLAAAEPRALREDRSGG